MSKQAPATKPLLPPAAAAIASVIPGAGQALCGEWRRGIGWFLWIIGQVVLLRQAPEPGVFLAGAGLLWLWNIYDAWRIARQDPVSLAYPIAFSALLNFAAGWVITKVNLYDLATGLPRMQHILAGLLSPELTAPDGSISPVLRQSLKLIVDTLYIALIGTLLPIPITFVLSVLGARNLVGRSKVGLVLYAGSRSIMNLLRSIEVIIIAVMMTVAVGIGAFAGMLALAIHGIGAQGKLYSEAIEDIDPGPVEAITATGAGWLQQVVYGVMPQVTPQFIAFTMYRWDINVRMATVIGLVGGGGIGYTLIQYIHTLQWQQAGTAIWLIAIAVILMDWASAAVRKRFS